MKTRVSRHPVAFYFVLAYAISWSLAVPLAMQAQGILNIHLPWALHYLTAYGPALAALSMMRLLREPLGGTRAPAAQPWSRTARWWTIGFAAPLLMFAAAQLAARAAGQAAPSWNALGHISFLPDLGPGAWWLWLATSGAGEEVGWRGFLLPRLQQRHSPFVSSVLLGIGWAGWHIPAFFYIPGYAAMGLRMVPAFFLGILAGAIVLTWLYNSSGGSVMAAALWHASFNFVTASPDAAGLAAAVTSTLVMVWAIVVMVVGTLGTPRRTYGRSVRASADERTRALPGDALIPACRGSFTHAITIHRRPDAVWPWLVQMGAGSRAGWYSYDWLDNGRRPSAARIEPVLQQVSVGSVFPALPGVTDCFTLLAFEPERYLILGWWSADRGVLMTWAFVLERTANESTRLIVRARAGAEYRFQGLPLWLTAPIVRVVHAVMERKQLLGIARRVEAGRTMEDTA